MKAKIDQQWQSWLNKKHPCRAKQRINRHRIYVLPSKFGAIFFLMIFSLFIGSVNYQLSSGFFLTFLLLSLAMLSAWVGHQNLNGITFSIMPVPDTAANQPFNIPIQLTMQKQKTFALNFTISEHHKQYIQLTTNQIIQVPFIFRRRGYHPVPRICIQTYFPLGLFVVWSYLTFDSKVYVYPEPKSPGFWPEPSAQGNQLSTEDGDEDFYALKQSDNPWKQPSRISWTTVAKGFGWYEKQYQAPHKTRYLLTVDTIKAYPLEEGLKFISYWLLECEKRGYDYAFQSHSKSVESHGQKHLTQQLRLLATYGHAKTR